jgi:hypothetical protein
VLAYLPLAEMTIIKCHHDTYQSVAKSIGGPLQDMDQRMEDIPPTQDCKEDAFAEFFFYRAKYRASSFL